MDTAPLTTDQDHELRELQGYGATSNSPVTISKKLVLHEAVKQGDTQEVSRILNEEKGKEHLTQSNDLGEFPLHLACKHGNVDIVKILLGLNTEGTTVAEYKQRNQMEKRNKVFGNTPLHLAALFGYVEIVKLLLELDDEDTLLLEVRNRLKNTPVHLAAIKGRLEVLVAMREKKPRCIHLSGRFDGTPLHSACGYGHDQVVEKLLEWGANIESRSCPVMLPAFTRTTEFLHENNNTLTRVSDAIEEQVRIEEENQQHDQFTPLTRACQFGRIEVVKILLDKRARAYPLALIKAIQGHYPECAKCLLQVVCGTPRYKGEWIRLLDYAYVPRGKKQLTTPFCDLIKYMPNLAELVLQKCARIERHLVNTPKFKIELDFRFLNDRCKSDEIEYTDYEGGSLVDRRDILKRYGYSKANHPLSIMARYRRQKLLEHPIVAALIQSKWRAYGIFHIGNWLLYLIHLIFFTALMFTLPHPQNPVCSANVDMNISMVLMNGTHKTNSSPKVLLYALAFVVLLHSVFRMVQEIYQIVYSLKLAFIHTIDKEEDCCSQFLHFITNIDYFRSWMNWVGLLLSSLSIVFASATFASIELHKFFCPYNWQWQIGIVVTWLTWIEFIVLSTQFRFIGVYALMFVKILKRVIGLSLVAFLLIVAFGLTFHFLLYKPEFMGSPYFTPGRSLLQVLAMMIGNVNADEFFGLSLRQHVSDTSHLSYPALTTVAWLFSLIFMTIILSNLLIGLAVKDIQTIFIQANLRKLALQIDYILTMESKLPQKLRDQIQTRKIVLEPNNVSRKEAFLSWLVYFIWGGIRYDTHENIERLLPHEV